MAITWNELKIYAWPKKRDAYTLLSGLLLLVLSITLINDMVWLWGRENTLNTSQSFTMALLLLHTVGFYLGTLGFLYTTQRIDRRGLFKALHKGAFVILGHVVVFCLRVAMEIAWIDYRSEFYRGTTGK